MFRNAFIAIISTLALVGCDTVARGTANTAGFAVKQTVRGGYAVGKGAVRGTGRLVTGGGRETGPEVE